MRDTSNNQFRAILNTLADALLMVAVAAMYIAVIVIAGDWAKELLRGIL